ncbi:MAG: Hsp70 family protein [Armatimonadota bacterium]|nr:Hsp70 family protein [Armatimonadota bacterium]
MARQTIDFGIDLGTTNSAIAVFDGIEAEVIPNNENLPITPSAVRIDDSGAVTVGKTPRERYFRDPDNGAIEFKRLMGEQETISFADSGRSMTPAELSAEVLKSLKSDVQQRVGEELNAAVVTVPAEFGLPQNKATDKAAQFAGFSQRVLLQEPIAAALAYGFQAEDEDVFWMVYDMGGGTFDVAIIQMRDGMIEVINHGGDQYLGGKNVDEAIVKDLLIPQVVSRYDVSDFRLGNEKWRVPLAKLRLSAEDAKIRLSRQPTAQVDIDYLGNDDRGQPMADFLVEVSQADVERILEPMIVRTINAARKVLEEKRLSPGDIERLLLVGGPTATPYLRQRLEDPTSGLGIPLDFSQDPMTVVACGAAIFAGTQRLEEAMGPAVTVEPGQYRIELEYDPIGPDPDPLIGGKVIAQEGGDVSGFTIEFVNRSLPHDDEWRSGQVPLGPDGTFTTVLFAERGLPNEFGIDLRDATGSALPAVPESITYTVGGVPDRPILTHSLGVAMANNEVDRFFEKGTPLPARARSKHKTTVAVRRGGQHEELIRIPVVQGENTVRADRNKLVGALEITPDEIRRDVRQGSEVDITIEIDESQRVLTKAWVPVLDEEFEEVLDLNPPPPDVGALQREVSEERRRLTEARQQAIETGDPVAREALDRIEQERLLESAEGSAEAAAEGQKDAARQCQDLLLRLRSAVDEVEDALQWPALVSKAEEAIEEAERLVSDPEIAAHGGGSVDAEVRALREAIQQKDRDTLQARLDDLQRKVVEVLQKHPAFWVALFEHLQGLQLQMTDQAQAQQLIARGQQAIADGDVASLQGVCQQLVALVPGEVAMPEGVPGGLIGTTTKFW